MLLERERRVLLSLSDLHMIEDVCGAAVSKLRDAGLYAAVGAYSLEMDSSAARAAGEAGSRLFSVAASGCAGLMVELVVRVCALVGSDCKHSLLGNQLWNGSLGMLVMELRWSNIEVLMDNLRA